MMHLKHAHLLSYKAIITFVWSALHVFTCVQPKLFMQCKWCLFESTDSLKLHSARWRICPSSYGNKIQTLSASWQIKKQEERKEKEQNHFGENWSQLSRWYQTRSHNIVRYTLLCQFFLSLGKVGLSEPVYGFTWNLVSGNNSWSTTTKFTASTEQFKALM